MRAGRFPTLLPSLIALIPALGPDSPAPAAAPCAPGAPAAPQDPLDDELEALLAEERIEADRLRRRGQVRTARSMLLELLDGAEEDAATRVLLARCEADEARWERAEAEAARALDDAVAAGDEVLATACARVLADVLLLLGRGAEALDSLGRAGGLAPDVDARDAWVLGRARLGAGDREGARAAMQAGSRTPVEQGPEGLLARALCQRWLGLLERASESLQLAHRAALRSGGGDPDIAAAFGDFYFEAYRELYDDRLTKPGEERSSGMEYRAALALNPTHEGALLGMFTLARFNPMRDSRPAHAWLDELLTARQDSIRGLVTGAWADLEDGMLRSAHARLDRLDELAPARRDVRAARATLAWIENDRESCAALMAALAEEDPGDAEPERRVGATLNRLYRFAEALPFLRGAVERDASDHQAWTELGRSLANTGDGAGGLAALQRAEDAAGLRKDAWRHNTLRALKRIEASHGRHDAGELVFSWRPDAAPVLERYLVPYYREAREEFAQRYGFTPGRTEIVVFRDWEDFSARSVGFPGFPALGVCFGPVVTAVSPLSQLRGSFNWAETAFHEFSHVVHLGLSHNRCPRWITEGLATWEETNRDPSWTRNMRVELLNAHANNRIIPVRELNRAFGTSRILFAYYQGGLLCEMLIERHGFQPMVRLLEAFDRGLDLDAAFAEVFRTTPEEVDAAFGAWVAAKVDRLAIEPLRDARRAAFLRLSLGRTPPEDEAARAEWAEDWCSLAWTYHQARSRVDAEDALRVLDQAGVEHPRLENLRGLLALLRGEEEEARAHFERMLALGGEDYHARMALAEMARNAGELEQAEVHLLGAEAAFPGYPAPGRGAELQLAALYELMGRPDDAMRARERHLRWSSDDLSTRLSVAAWHLDAGRAAEAARLFEEANRIDPFRRELHASWARALLEDGRPEEALSELEVAELVPPELDAEARGPIGKSERAGLDGLRARALLALGRAEEARAAAEAALEADPEQADAKLALEELG